MVLLTCSLLLSVATAALKTHEDDPAFVAGLSLFEDFEYEKATFRFEEALAVSGRSRVDQATILIRLGMTWAELRREAKANDAFVRALEADPYAALPADASPKIKGMLDTARATVRESRASSPPDEKLAKTDNEDSPPRAAAEETATPNPEAPGVTASTANEASRKADAPANGLPWLLISGGAIVGIGVLGSAIGGALWGAGLALREVGNGQAFQSDALAYDLPAQAGQYAGQGVLAVGVVALVVGGGVSLVSFALE